MTLINQLDNIIGHNSIKNILIQSYKRNMIPNAWLFSGEKGLGKASLARLYASLLLNIRVSDLDNYADYYQLKSENKLTSIDEVRDLQKFTARKSAFGGKRIVIIDSLNDLSKNAANSLLKILEEPGSNLHFILINHENVPILDTIKSRSVNLNFTKLTQNEFDEILKQQKITKEYSQQEVEIISYFSLNNVGNFLKLSDSDFINYHKNICDIIYELKNKNYKNLISFLSSKEFNFEFSLIILKNFLSGLVNEHIRQNFTNLFYHDYGFVNIDYKQLIYLWNKITYYEQLERKLNLPKDKIILYLISNLAEGLINGKILYNHTDILCQ